MDTGLRAEARVRIQLHGHLWRYLCPREPQVEVIWQQGKPLVQMLEELGIPGEQVMVALVKDKPFPLTGCPEPGDIVELLPVIDGG